MPSETTPGTRQAVVVPVIVHVKQDEHETAARTGHQYVLDALREFDPAYSRLVDHVEVENARVIVA